MAALEEHEDALRARIEAGLAALPGVTLYSRAARRTPTLLLTFDGRDAADAYRFLAERGVNAPAGSLLRARGLAGPRPGRHRRPAGRPGALHDAADVDRLLAGLREFLAVR